mmetsp:Transcript_2341/g.9153  ORF Transcript_2341/g.9153 Transcript_2341/m.9153 type:complete len:205 (-) Transcript_2341:1749-2363(-)
MIAGRRRVLRLPRAPDITHGAAQAGPAAPSPHGGASGGFGCPQGLWPWRPEARQRPGGQGAWRWRNASSASKSNLPFVLARATTSVQHGVFLFPSSLPAVAASPAGDPKRCRGPEHLHAPDAPAQAASGRRGCSGSSGGGCDRRQSFPRVSACCPSAPARCRPLQAAGAPCRRTPAARHSGGWPASSAEPGRGRAGSGRARIGW